VRNKPSTLIGTPYDRPVVGYGGKTVNTLRLWAAATHDHFDFQQFSSGDFVGALAETLTAETLTRVLYPDDSTTEGKGLRFLQQYFLVACTLADAIRRFRAGGNAWSALPEKVAIPMYLAPDLTSVPSRAPIKTKATNQAISAVIAMKEAINRQLCDVWIMHSSTDPSDA
jgi:hypothetical protein